MNINITVRHAKLSEGIKEYASEKLENTLKEYPRVEMAHIIFDMEKFRHIAEIVVQGKNHLRLEARDISDDMYKSVDAVLDKINKQLRRSRDKVIDHKIRKHRTTLRDIEKTEDTEQTEQ